MKARNGTRTRLSGLVLTAILGTSVGAVMAGILPTRTNTSESGMEAWSHRLTEQAEALREARAWEAWSGRLAGVAQERTDEAWTDRLNGLADAQGLRGMSDRAADAWTDRLNGLADYLAER